MLQSSDNDDSSAAEAFLNQLTAAVHESQTGLELMTTQVSSLQQELHSLNAARSSNNTNNNQASGNQFRPPNPPMYQSNDIQQAFNQVPLMPPVGNPQNPIPHSSYHVPYQPFNNNMNNYPPQSFLNHPNQGNHGNHQNNRRPRPNPSNNRGSYRNANHQSNYNNSNNWNQPSNQFQHGSTNFNNGGNNRVNHYCWTHGRGGHPSSQCRTPSNGHQLQSTFSNRMNGSNDGCWN